jgi:hypothetical protein
MSAQPYDGAKQAYPTHPTRPRGLEEVRAADV